MTARTTTRKATNADVLDALANLTQMLAAALAAPSVGTPTMPKARTFGEFTCDCGATAVRKAPNQKRCPACQQARAVAFEDAKQDPQHQRAVSLRQQWKAAKADAHLFREVWGIPALTTLAQALEQGLLVDVDGVLTPKAQVAPPKARRSRKAKAAEPAVDVEREAALAQVMAIFGIDRPGAESLLAQSPRFGTAS